MEETVEDIYRYLLKKGGPWKVLKITRKDGTEEVSVEIGINSSGIKRYAMIFGFVAKDIWIHVRTIP